VYNPRLDYLLGFDMNLVGTLNFNTQYVGNWILQHEEIQDPFDVEQGTEAWEGTLVARLSDQFFQNKLELSLAGAWNFQAQDGFVFPQLSYQLTDEAQMIMEGRYFLGEETGLFGSKNEQSFLQLAFRYRF